MCEVKLYFIHHHFQIICWGQLLQRVLACRCALVRVGEPAGSGIKYVCSMFVRRCGVHYVAFFWQENWYCAALRLVKCIVGNNINNFTKVERSNLDATAQYTKQSWLASYQLETNKVLLMHRKAQTCYPLIDISCCLGYSATRNVTVLISLCWW